jgi:hypothetical protein
MGNLNFMEAVEEMKNGNKVKRKPWGFTIEGLRTPVYSDNLKHFHAHYIDIEATDWEVVEDNWNLKDAKENLYWGITGERIYILDNVKKCRDLILKDIWKEDKLYLNRITDIVKKRFGDL